MGLNKAEIALVAGEILETRRVGRHRGYWRGVHRKRFVKKKEEAHGKKKKEMTIRKTKNLYTLLKGQPFKGKMQKGKRDRAGSQLKRRKKVAKKENIYKTCKKHS